MPFAGALGLAMAVGAGIDVATGRAALVSESQHLLELAGLVLLWITSRRPVDPTLLLDRVRRPRPAFAA